MEVIVNMEDKNTQKYMEIPQISDNREFVQKRKHYGPRVLKSLENVLGERLSLSDLNLDFVPKQNFKWTLDSDPSFVSAETCPGLNSGYITRNSALDIARCIDDSIGLWEGYLGFSEHSYVGHVELKGTSVVQLLSLAENLQDTIYLYSNSVDGVVMIDFEYDDGVDDENDFTIVVQGESLELLLSNCFEAR